MSEVGDRKSCVQCGNRQLFLINYVLSAAAENRERRSYTPQFVCLNRRMHGNLPQWEQRLTMERRTDGSLTCDVEGKANEPTACAVRRRLRYSPRSLARSFTHTSIPDSIPFAWSLRSEGGRGVLSASPVVCTTQHRTQSEVQTGESGGRAGRTEGGASCILVCSQAACTQYSLIHSFLPSSRQRARKMSWTRANPQFSHLTFSLLLASIYPVPPSISCSSLVRFLPSRHLHAMHGGGGWCGVN